MNFWLTFVLHQILPIRYSCLHATCSIETFSKSHYFLYLVVVMFRNIYWQYRRRCITIQVVGRSWRTSSCYRKYQKIISKNKRTNVRLKKAWSLVTRCPKEMEKRCKNRLDHCISVVVVVCVANTGSTTLWIVPVCWIGRSYQSGLSWNKYLETGRLPIRWGRMR